MGVKTIQNVIPGDKRNKDKEQEKMEKYEKLKEEIGRVRGNEEGYSYPCCDSCKRDAYRKLLTAV